MLGWLTLIVALLLPSAYAAEAPSTETATAEAPAPEPGPLRVSQDGTRLVLFQGDRELLTEEFALLVGDHHTARAYNLGHKRVLLSSWVLWGMGGVGLASGMTLFTMLPLSDQPPVVGASAATLALLGGMSLGFGFATYQAGMARLDDPGTWYTREQAEIWVASQAGSTRPLQLRPVFTGNGLALAARW